MFDDSVLRSIVTIECLQEHHDHKYSAVLLHCTAHSRFNTVKLESILSDQSDVKLLEEFKSDSIDINYLDNITNQNYDMKRDSYGLICLFRF